MFTGDKAFLFSRFQKNSWWNGLISIAICGTIMMVNYMDIVRRCR